MRRNVGKDVNVLQAQLANLKCDMMACNAGSQVFTRLATFGLNQIVTKALSVEAYGVSPAQPGCAYLCICEWACLGHNQESGLDDAVISKKGGIQARETPGWI